jgi:hypothetical protein
VTAINFYARMVEDLGQADNDRIYKDRLEIINDAVNCVSGQFYSLLRKYYLTETCPTVTAGRIDLSPYRVARVGNETDFVVLARKGNRIVTAEPNTLEGIAMFVPSLFQNKWKIIYAYVDNQLFVGVGDELYSGVEIVLYYPRMPIPASADASNIDIPDGTPMEIAIKKAKHIVFERLGGEVRDYSQQLSRLIQDMYTSFGTRLTKEQLEEHIKGLS